MTRKSSWIVYILLIPVFLSGSILFFSSPFANIQKEIATDAGITSASVEQFSFGAGGFILLGQDKNGDGILRAYTKFPIINRYAKTKAFSYSKADQPLQLAGESWAGYQALTFEESKLTVASDASGIGFVRTLLRWFALSNLGALIITIILNRFFRQEGKPWWKK